MADSKTRLSAARLLLGRGVQFTIKDAPFFFRLFRLNKITIRQLKLGTIVHICRVMDENELSDRSRPEDVNRKLEAMALVIAIAMLNDKTKIKYGTHRLAKILTWRLSAETVFEIFSLIAPLNRISDFMSITSYFDHLTTMVMSPKLGQTTMRKGS